MSDPSTPPGHEPPSGYGPPPGQGPPPGYPTPPPPDGASDAKGFFGALFDFSFSTFITPMIVKFVYAIATVVLGLVMLIVIVSAFSQSAGFGLVLLVISPVIYVLYLAFIRMTLEFYLAITRMSQDINQRLPRV